MSSRTTTRDTFVKQREEHLKAIARAEQDIAAAKAAIKVLDNVITTLTRTRKPRTTPLLDRT